MNLELLGSWSFTAPKKPSGPFFFSAGEHLAAQLDDGTLEVRRGVKDLPVVASVKLPKGASAALDPRGGRIAYVVGSKVTLADLSGKALETAALDEEFALTSVEFRKDGARLWVLGQTSEGFRVYAFDRDLGLDFEQVFDFGEGTSTSVEVLHPTKDDLVLITQSGDEDPDEATSGRVGVVRENGKLEIVFDDQGPSYPCVGFTPDGASLIGVDFSGVTLHPWPAYVGSREAPQPEGSEGGLAGIVVGARLLTERHDENRPETTSSLLVLSLPSLEEEAVISWNKRGDFAKPKDSAGLDLSAAIGDDRFLELSPGKKGVWTCRAWRLAPLRGPSAPAIRTECGPR